MEIIINANSKAQSGQGFSVGYNILFYVSCCTYWTMLVKNKISELCLCRHIKRNIHVYIMTLAYTCINFCKQYFEIFFFFFLFFFFLQENKIWQFLQFSGENNKKMTSIRRLPNLSTEW